MSDEGLRLPKQSIEEIRRAAWRFQDAGEMLQLASREARPYSHDVAVLADHAVRLVEDLRARVVHLIPEDQRNPEATS